ncbi:hypothetical protein HF1_12590 [Mycoplasma haemofelis str. Langford 1]|uniref:Uncharacterized protein n=1 Tax=Mycoplasma haemofelis (strain Langford 1) TaxID=941640 RepID=E8ZJE6_MYCHL|nr:hypothetical protein [Mycoplasma haemofelis]CBY93267.1 hypothetical protein HF1_12590 [Mycoplasma haemofelis str. Langford 1]
MDLTKLLFTLIGSSGVAATGAYLTKDSWMPPKKSIEDALTGKKLISSMKGEALTKQWQEEFESDRESIKGVIGFKDNDKENGGLALSKWCSDQMSLDFLKNQEVFKNVEKYCLIRSVSSQLSRKGKSLLADSDASGWSATYAKRKEKSTPREDLGLSKDWVDNKESEELPTIKTWCSKNSKEDFIDSGENSLYIKVLKWCTSDGSKEN